MRTPVLPSGVRTAWGAWGGSRPAAAARWLSVAACATLFLQSALTFRVFYTLQVPYVLTLGALAIGLPHVVRGWAALPPLVRTGGAWMVVAYIVVTLASDPIALIGSGRGGRFRDAVYLTDLGVGLALLGLIPGLFARRSLRAPVTALVAGGGVAAAYGLYQAAARRYGWPLADVNNTLDSNGVTAGISQGAGFMGIERVRGTFLEPHFLGTFLAMVLPVAVALAWSARGRRRQVGIAASALIPVALLLTASAPSWAELVLASLGAAVIVAIARGRALLSGLLIALVVAAALGAASAIVYPQVLIQVTGRSAEELEGTSQFRLDIWNDSLYLWGRRPVTGWGPGQSAVRLAVDRESPQGPPISAQGLWTASLVDGGILGFSAWLLLLGGILGACAARVVRRLEPLTLALLASAVSAVAAAGVAGDRLEIRVWTILGLLLAAAAAARGQGGAADRGRGHEEAGEASGERPQWRVRLFRTG